MMMMVIILRSLLSLYFFLGAFQGGLNLLGCRITLGLQMGWNGMYVEPLISDTASLDAVLQYYKLLEQKIFNPSDWCYI